MSEWRRLCLCVCDECQIQTNQTTYHYHVMQSLNNYSYFIWSEKATTTTTTRRFNMSLYTKHISFWRLYAHTRRNDFFYTTTPGSHTIHFTRIYFCPHDRKNLYKKSYQTRKNNGLQHCTKRGTNFCICLRGKHWHKIQFVYGNECQKCQVIARFYFEVWLSNAILELCRW